MIMGKKQRRKVSEEMTAESTAERARRGRYAGELETQAGSFLRGEHTPEVEATRTFWDTQREQAANRLAVTGNRAGYGALQTELGREEGRQVADVTRRGRLHGVNILGQLYGGSTGYLSNLYGIRTQEAVAPQGWQRLLQAGIGGAGEAAGAYYGAKGGGGGGGQGG